MKKSTSSVPKVALIIIILGLLGVALYAVVTLDKEKATTTTQVEEVQVEGVGQNNGKEPETGVGTLAKLTESKRDLECQIVVEKEGEERVEGTFFTSGGNMRGDFMVPAQEFGGQVLSSMIIGGSSMYVWSTINGETFGFKSDVQKDAEKPVDANEPVSLDSEVRYTCTKWEQVDGSVFVPPADVQFRDLNAVMDAGMEYGTLPN
jgi:hypothetical protein